MTTLELTITLPDELAREAAARGLLTAEKVAALISAEIERQQHAQLIELMNRLAAVDLPPLTNAEVNEEIRAARAERKARRAADT